MNGQDDVLSTSDEEVLDHSGDLDKFSLTEVYNYIINI